MTHMHKKENSENHKQVCLKKGCSPNLEGPLKGIHPTHFASLYNIYIT